MSIEHELRFFIRDTSEEFFRANATYVHQIQQYYLRDTGGWTARLRESKVYYALGDTWHHEACYTMKRPHPTIAGASIELETRDAYDMLKAVEENADTLVEKWITKTRYVIRHLGEHRTFDWEVDFFAGHPAIAELEIQTYSPECLEEAMEHPPVWIGEEITGDKRYSNYALAKPYEAKEWR